jgi:predicted ATPase
LHSGLVVTYMVASEFSRVFELGGPAQHMAVRLEGLAKAGEIWASESCKSLSEGHVAFEHLGFKTLKGFANPIPVYRVVAVHDIVSWRIRKSRMISRFVGRSTEIAQLRRAAAETTDHGQACHLVGDAGIGKSRLVHEFVQELTSAGWVLIRTECSPTLRASPFAALKSLLLAMRGYLRERSRGGPDLWGQLPQLWQAAVDSVLGLAVLHPPWDELTPDLRGRAICEAFQRVVLMVADQQPVILLIEDVHWLDSASSTVIGSLDWPNLPKHLFVLATSRPDETPDWCSNPATEKLLIQPLDAQSGRSMLDDMLGLSVSTAELKNRISEHTGNVPLFIEEVCRRLREIGVVQGEWGRMTATSLPRELDIPPSVQGVIAARIDRLLRDERRLLQIAACIGPTATVATLRGVAAIPETVLQRLLTALDAAELLIEVQTPSAPSYRFPHELVRQVTYDSMLERARTRLHGRILSTLESLAGPDAR